MRTMALKILPAIFLLLASSSFAAAQTQTADASQSSAVSAAISSYTHSLLTGPVATSLAVQFAIGAGVPESELASIASDIPNLLPSFTSGEDLYSFATAVPTFTEPSWITQVGSDVSTGVEALRTSVYLAEKSIVKSVLGVTAEIASATATTAAASASTGAAVALGRGMEALVAGGAVVAIGAAAML